MNSRAPKVTIIIPHYNQKECLQRLLPSVDRQTLKDFEVMIIDDRTPDEDTINFVQDFVKDRPNMHLLQNSENMRFIRTCNKGIHLAKGEYICLLNSDTEITANFVESNVRIMDSDTTIGGLSCVIVDKYGKNWFSGGLYKNGTPVNLTDDFRAVRSVDFVAGTAAFYRRDIFDTIGLFDERYIMYHEDVEFGLRISAKTGYRLCMFPDKLVTHFVVPSIPNPEMFYYLNRNSVLLSTEYEPKSLPRLILRLLLHSVGVPLLLAAKDMVLLRPSASWRMMRCSLSAMRGSLDGLIARRGP